MRFKFCVLVLLLVDSINVVGQGKPVVEVSSDRRNLEIRLSSGRELPTKFAHLDAKKLVNYTLYELEPLDSPGEITADRTKLLDSGVEPECIGTGCPRLRIHLKAPLAVNQTYIIAIKQFTDRGDTVTARFEVKPDTHAPIVTAVILKGPDAYNQRSQLQLESDTPLDAQPQLQIHRRFYRLTHDNLHVLEDSDVILGDVQNLDDKLFVLNLHSKLPQGQDHDLFITDGLQIKGYPGQSVKAAGKVKIGGAPTNPEEIRLDINLGAIAAVQQKPVFDLTAKYIPTRIYKVKNTNWIWEPTLAVDVGLRSTKSANSVVVAPLNFSNYFGENLPAFQAGRRGEAPTLQTKDRDGTNIPTYANWMNTPWYRPSDVKLTLGPKAEFDRNFKRKNVLGSLRLELDFHRWRASINDKRRVLTKDFGEDVSNGIRINYGWSTVPYISFDVGGHVNNETVSNSTTNASVFVPRHKIFRSYLGFVTTFESNKFYLPLTITIDESVFYLAASETIGFDINNVVGLRRLHGVQHRGKATFNLALDPSKHYNFSMSYENGRLAPNFEYLNKFTTGFRMVFW